MVGAVFTKNCHAGAGCEVWFRTENLVTLQ